jgi:hypothetical protein
MTCTMTDYRSEAWLESLLGERPYIAYHPRWNALTGSPMASILLHQILYHWWKFGRRPFWKFSAPCATAQPGDTWVEELGVGVREFRRVRAKIARKVSKGASRTQLLEQWLVLYWIDARRLTWYEVNESLLARRLDEIDADGASPDSVRTESDLYVGTKSDPTIRTKGGLCPSTQSGPFHVSTESGLSCSKKKNKNQGGKGMDPSLSKTGDAGRASQETPDGRQDAAAAPGEGCGDAGDGGPDAAAALLWETLLGELRLQVDGATFDRWLARSYGLRLAGGVLQVGVANAAAKDWLEHRLVRLVERTMGYVAPDTRVEFVVEEPWQAF